MRAHKGMRPQDIVILSKIICNGDTHWQNKDLAEALHISPSEISESLNRSMLAGMINDQKRKVLRQSFLEFILYGFHYVFPALPGSMANGIYTAQSHPWMSKQFRAEIQYVWPYPRGEVRGLAIEPLYPAVVYAVQNDEQLYKMLALMDVLRVGKARELKVAVSELEKMIRYGT